MADLCRLCSAPLRGSRRKWLFGGSGTLPALYSHVFGSPVGRAQPGSSPRSVRGPWRPEDCEFLCGKCCHSLNVYHRYDLVMSRMRELHDQRSARLLSEKEKLSFTLRRIHAKAWNLPLPDYQECRTPRYGSYHDLRTAGPRGSPGYQNSSPGSPFPGRHGSFHGSFGSLSSGTPSKSYQQLLDQDRSQWEHESWWEERAERCPRCAKGDKCVSCSSWRVPDANYETVCTVPRQKRRSRGDGGECGSERLLRSRSLGSFVGGSSRGSLLSFSTSSLEALSTAGEEDEEAGVFWESSSPATSPPPAAASLAGEALKILKEIKSCPVTSPALSKIPVRRRGPRPAGAGDERREEAAERPLEAPLEVEDDWDTYLGIGSEVLQTQVARSLRIKDAFNLLQTQLQTALGNNDARVGKERPDLVRVLTKSLTSKEEALENCLALLLSLPVTSDPSGQSVMTFVEKIRDQEQELKRVWRELEESDRQREAEAKRLQLELDRSREDLERLSRVLRENQDTIAALRDLLGEKDFTIRQLEVALDSAVRTAASQDALRLSALREKDALIAAMQGVLSSSNQDVEALADSLLSQGLDDLSGSIPGVSSPGPLITQLQEKSRLLSQAQANNQRQSVQHQEDIRDLLNALNESQSLLQAQLQHCKQRLQAGEGEQKKLRDALRDREAELRAEKQKRASDMHEAHTELLHLHGVARERDQTTQKLLQEAQCRDETLIKLQERLREGGGMRDTQ